MSNREKNIKGQSVTNVSKFNNFPKREKKMKMKIFKSGEFVSV